MSFDYDDNLKPHKRKNTNPARSTNLLIIGGFIILAGLIIFFMSDKSDEGNFTDVNVEETVNARLLEPTPADIATVPSAFAPTMEPRPQIEGTHLSVGKSAVGVINDESFELHYTFAGQANMPFIITLQGHDLQFPELVLTNPSGRRVIASTSTEQPIGTDSIKVIGTILQSDGDYTITVTREGGRVGESEGNFTLMLDIPPSLDARKRIEGVAYPNTWNWYTYRNDDPFAVIYTHEEGDYKPDVGIYTLNARSEFVQVAYLVGSDTTYSEIGNFDPLTRYFIAVGQSMIQSNEENLSTAGHYTLKAQLAR